MRKKIILCLLIVWIIFILFTIVSKCLSMIETKTFIMLLVMEIVNILFLGYTLKNKAFYSDN